MHIDPKAPADSPQHPRNWRQPVFSSPPAGDYTMDLTPVESVPTPPPAPATPPKKTPVRKTGKRVTHAKADLAAALAKLSEK